MQISIHDLNLKKVGFLNNDVPGLPSFYDDTYHPYLAEGAATFTFSVNKLKNGVVQNYCQYLTEQSYFSFTDEAGDHIFMVISLDENDETMTFTCATLNLELSNEYVDPFSSTTAHTLVWYIDQMDVLDNTTLTIGDNELSDLTMALSYDDQDTKLSRLIGLIGDFGGEFEFKTSLNFDGTIESMTLNIKNSGGVGQVRDDVILQYAKNISGIEKQVDKTNLFNATTITDQNGVFNWNSLSVSTDDGNGGLITKSAGNATMVAGNAAAMFPPHIMAGGDLYIRKNLQIDAKSAQDLIDYGVSQLKQYAYPTTTYIVNALSKIVNSNIGNGTPLHIGDTVRIQDLSFYGGLYLSARVTELEISFSDPSKNAITFSNFVVLKSQISQNLQAQMQALINATTPYVANITTTNGVTFKNGTGSTDLTAHIYKGSSATETIADSYEWFKDGVSIATTQAITVNASDITDKSVYSYQATVGGNVVGTAEVTIANVDDGTDGVSPIIIQVVSSNGNSFKNGLISTTLTAQVLQNNVEIDPDGSLYTYIWTKTNADGTADNTWNSAHASGAKTLAITASDFNGNATFNCDAEEKGGN